MILSGRSEFTVVHLGHALLGRPTPAKQAYHDRKLSWEVCFSSQMRWRTRMQMACLSTLLLTKGVLAGDSVQINYADLTQDYRSIYALLGRNDLRFPSTVLSASKPKAHYHVVVGGFFFFYYSSWCLLKYQIFFLFSFLLKC